MDNPNPSHKERPGASIKHPLTPPEIQQWDAFPASSPQLNDLARENVTPTQIHSSRLEIKRHLQIGERCYAKYFEDGLYYSAKIVDIHRSAHTAVVMYDDYEVPEEVMAEDILPEIPLSKRLNPQSSSRERLACPPSQPESSNHPNFSFKRYKAFKILLADTSNTFDGSDNLKFLDWKDKQHMRNKGFRVEA